ncbi:MAG TPA: hypothetical protein EYP22_07435 [Methanosarcinales archaeon]|nr:hypothetical protein [Methanosarcinales archaeon]
MKKYILLIILLMFFLFPASAVSVRWSPYITIHDNGSVEGLIQVEIANIESPVEGFSIFVPSTEVTILSDFLHSASFTGLSIEKVLTSNGTNLIVHFNRSADKTWNGRIGYLAKNMVQKTGRNYIFITTLKSPKILTTKGSEKPVSEEIKMQIFLPKSIMLDSATPTPWQVLYQFEHIVPTWISLSSGDTIQIRGSYSETLHKIVIASEEIKSLEEEIKHAEVEGHNLEIAKQYLQNADDYNNKLAVSEFLNGKISNADMYAQNALDAIAHAKNYLNASSSSTSNAKSPMFSGLLTLIIIVILMKFIKKKK